jgi:hypothetical protein
MDDNMVVVPTEGGEVVGIIRPVARPMLNVVWLKSRGGSASVGGA